MSTIDIVIAGVCLLICIVSLWLGFIKKISGTLSFITAIILSYCFYETIFDYLGFRESILRYLVFFFVFVVAYILLRVFLKLFSKAIDKLKIIGKINHLLGLLIGLIESAVLLLVSSHLLWHIHQELAKQSQIMQYIINFTVR